MKRNRWLIPLGVLTAIAGLALAVVMVRASAADLLDEAARLLADATDGHAVVEIEFATPEKGGRGTVEVWGRREAGPNGEPAFRIEVLDTDMDEAAGAVAVSDGSQVWVWRPSQNRVYVGTFAELRARMDEYEGWHDDRDFERPETAEGEKPETPEELVDKLLEYFTAERAGTEDVAGTAAHKLRLVPIPEQMPDELRANGGLLNIWLRASDSAPLSLEYTGGAIGSGKATATLLELNEGVAGERFTFQIPEGAEVVNLADLEPPAPLAADEAAAAVGFDVLVPEQLPAAARLQGTYDMRGAVVQRYRLPDGQSFSVAQGPAEAAGMPGEEGEPVTVRGVEGLVFREDDGSRVLVTWTEGEMTFWVGGDVTAEQALAIANSLR